MSILSGALIVAGLMALIGLVAAVRSKDPGYVAAATAVLTGIVVLAGDLTAGMLILMGGMVALMVRTFQRAREARLR